MAYEPQFTISARLLSLVEEIAALRERIQGAAVELSWIPALQKDTRTRTRNVHASTAIEGNPLTLEQVRALEEGRELAASDVRSSREVLNYFAGLRYEHGIVALSGIPPAKGELLLSRKNQIVRGPGCQEARDGGFEINGGFRVHRESGVIGGGTGLFESLDAAG